MKISNNKPCKKGYCPYKLGTDEKDCIVHNCPKEFEGKLFL